MSEKTYDKEGLEQLEERAYKRGYNDALDEMMREIAWRVGKGYSFEDLLTNEDFEDILAIEGFKEKLFKKLKEFYQSKYL